MFRDKSFLVQPIHAGPLSRILNRKGSPHIEGLRDKVHPLSHALHGVPKTRLNLFIPSL